MVPTNPTEGSSSAAVHCDKANLRAADADLGGESFDAVKPDLLADATLFSSQKERGRTAGKETDCGGTGAGAVSASAEGFLKIGAEFVEGFYHCLASAPQQLHLMYSSECDVTWSIYEKSFSMKSPKDVQNVMAINTNIQGEFRVCNHLVQVNKHSIHVVVNGFHKLGCRSSNFVQSFVLRRRTSSILNDAMIVVLNVPQLRIKIRTASTQAAQIRADDSEAAVGGAENSEVLIVYNEACLKHEPSKGDHHEKPDRIRNILASLRKDGVLQRVVCQGSDRADRNHVLAVHSEEHLQKLIDNLPLSAEQLELCPYASEDMYSSPGTLEAVYLAAGAVIKACDSVINDQFKKAFALVRPPGHHARSEFSEGFCFLNNAAIGIKYLQNYHALKKILLVDIDVHHGNGSQQIFFEDDSVLVFSTHCKSLGFPAVSLDKKKGMGHKAIGDGKGRGFNVNVPLAKRFRDADMLYALDTVLEPLVTSFRPDAILVSAGFDAAEGDDLGQCCLTPKCYGTIAKKLVKFGNGKLIMCLEGGYGKKALGDCVSHCLRALLGDDDVCLSEEELKVMEPSRGTVQTVRWLRDTLKTEWPVFNT